MRVTHTYQVQGEAAETRALKCPQCGFRATSIAFLVERPQRKKRGRGAVAMAQKVASGDVRLQEDTGP